MNLISLKKSRTFFKNVVCCQLFLLDVLCKYANKCQQIVHFNTIHTDIEGLNLISLISNWHFFGEPSKSIQKACIFLIESRHLLQYGIQENKIPSESFLPKTNIKQDFITDWFLPRNPPTNTNQKCRPHTSEFPSGIFTVEERKDGAILLPLVVLLYVCMAIGIACDYYFVPSLEVICHVLNIQEDVGGASLMCIGSSIPDIAAAVIGKKIFS